MARRNLHQRTQERKEKRELPLDPFGHELRTGRFTDLVITKRDDDELDDDDSTPSGSVDEVDDTDPDEAEEETPIGFKGHAAVFNKREWIGSKAWGFWEQIAEGAFAKTIGESDCRFLINHNPDLLLARTKSGTLRLAEDAVGLATDADLANTSYGDDLSTLLQRGDVDQMSFAFEVVKEQWEELDDGTELRTLLEVRLWDVSVVTYPAYADTDAGLRAVALDVLTRSMGLGAEQRRELDEVVNKIVHPNEPATATRSEAQPQPAETTAGTELDLIKLRHQHEARRHRAA